MQTHSQVETLVFCDISSFLMETFSFSLYFSIPPYSSAYSEQTSTKELNRKFMEKLNEKNLQKDNEEAKRQ